MNRKLTAFLAIVALIIFGYAMYSWLAGMKTPPKKALPPQLNRYVKAKTVKYENLPGVIETSGRLRAFDEVVISSEVSGRLTRGQHLFKSGQAFRKGDLIAVVENDEFIFQLKARKSKFLKAVAGILPDLKIDFPASYENWMHFFESVKIELPLPQLPKTNSSKERIFMATRNVLNDYYAIKSDEVRLSKHQIRAPFDGTIKKVNLQIGSVVNPGTKLAIFTRTDLFEIEVPVDEKNINLLKLGANVEVMDNEGNINRTGNISRIGGVINQATQSVSVYVVVKKSKEMPLFDGMYLPVRINGSTVNQVMEIPRNAVFNGNQVYLLKAKQLQKATIHISKINKETLYFNGIKEGEELVMEPVLGITETSRFEIIR
ncbi:efflux RND transporter periplasmic adaptor subunit [Marinilabiliaceae bacterium JC017]|nr:efflux RND transporter periplasmic adaptor subunit [Marinilabiliaceae bacterium JC017]